MFIKYFEVSNVMDCAAVLAVFIEKLQKSRALIGWDVGEADWPVGVAQAPDITGKEEPNNSCNGVCGWLIDWRKDNFDLTGLLDSYRTICFTRAGLKWPITAGQYSLFSCF